MLKYLHVNNRELEDQKVHNIFWIGLYLNSSTGHSPVRFGLMLIGSTRAAKF